MGRRPARWNPGKRKVADRPRIETPLGQWMGREGTKVTVLAEELGLSWKTLENWVLGRCQPPLIWAFKIELYTKGAVPASSWLATDLGKEMWKEGSDATR